MTGAALLTILSHCRRQLYYYTGMEQDRARMMELPGPLPFLCFSPPFTAFPFMCPSQHSIDLSLTVPGAADGWPLEVEAFGKGGQFETPPWHTFAVDGGSPDYPIQVQHRLCLAFRLPS